MKSQLTETDLLLIIIILIGVFIKSIISLEKYSNFLQLSSESLDRLIYYYEIYSDFMNIVFIYIAYYIYFVKQITNNIVTFLCVLLFIKSIFHFFINYELYKPLNVSIQTEQQLLKFKNIESIITNTILGFASAYALYIIFLK